MNKKHIDGLNKIAREFILKMPESMRKQFLIRVYEMPESVVNELLANELKDLKTFTYEEKS